MMAVGDLNAGKHLVGVSVNHRGEEDKLNRIRVIAHVDRERNDAGEASWDVQDRVITAPSEGVDALERQEHVEALV